MVVIGEPISFDSDTGWTGPWLDAINAHELTNMPRYNYHITSPIVHHLLNPRDLHSFTHTNSQQTSRHLQPQTLADFFLHPLL